MPSTDPAPIGGAGAPPRAARRRMMRAPGGKWCRAIFTTLKALPLLRFALMLGGGLVATGFEALLVWQIAAGRFPDDPAPRINGLTMIALAQCGVIGLVMVALAFGRIDKVNLQIAGQTVDLDFGDSK